MRARELRDLERRLLIESETGKEKESANESERLGLTSIERVSVCAVKSVRGCV